MARGRRQRTRRERGTVTAQLPWSRVLNPFRPTELLDEEQLSAIDDAAFRVLETIGMDFMHDEAIEILSRHGARPDPGSRIVRLDRHLVREMVAKAPERFMLRARNPAHDIGMGGREMVFAMMGSAPNFSDLEGGRRPGTFRDFKTALRLAQSLDVVHMLGGYPVEPTDLPAETRHLDCQRAGIALTDKPGHAYSLGRTRILDALEIIRLGHGLTEEELTSEPRVISIINTNSPLKLDGPMIEGMIELAPRNQAVAITPFTLSGAMAPATIAGALVQQHAEALAGIAFYQMIHAGAPCVYGSFTSNVDMRTGAPAFGTPEYFRSTIIGGQLARRWKLPYRTSNVNAANTVDAQAAYESMLSLWAVVQGGGNFVKHGLGWLEGGLTCSLEKTLLDAELLQMIRVAMEPLEVTEEAFGLDAIREVGPGGHFFGAAHTLERYADAFHTPMLSDWRNFETWQEAGSPTTMQHANARARELLAAYEPPAIDPARLEAIDAFIAKRKEEGGAVN